MDLDNHSPPQTAPGDPHGEESPSGLETQEAHSPAASAGRAPSAARTAGTYPSPTVHQASGWPHPCLVGPRPPCVGDGPALEATAGQGGWLPAGPRNEWLLQEHRDRGPVASVMPRPLPCGVPAEAAQLSGPRPCLALRAPAPPRPSPHPAREASRIPEGSAVCSSSAGKFGPGANCECTRPAPTSAAQHLQSPRHGPASGRGLRLRACEPGAGPRAGLLVPAGSHGGNFQHKDRMPESEGNCSANFRSDQNVLSIKSRLKKC